MKLSIPILTLCLAMSCNPDNAEPLAAPPTTEIPDTPAMSGNSTTGMQLTIGNTAFTATLTKTSAAEVLLAQLPLTLLMSEMNGNEKYASLATSLPTSASRPETIQRGDIMLYGSSTLVVFYETFSNGYHYTPIGHIEDPAGLAEALGRGSVTVKFELQNEKR